MKYKKIFIILFVSLFSSPLAHSAGVGTIGFGPSIGFAMPNTSSTTLAFGLNFIYKLNPLLGVALFYEKYSASINSVSGTNEISSSTSATFFGLQPTYYFTGSNFNIGLKIGSAKNAINGSAIQNTNQVFSIDDSTSGFFVGPSLNYDVNVGIVSIGGELAYLYGLGSSSPKALTLLGTCKFWF